MGKPHHESNIMDERTVQRLGEPFDSIFKSAAIAEWACELMRETSFKLGWVPEDARFAFTYRKDLNGIHYNFGNWLLLGFYGKKDGRLIVRLPFMRSRLPLLDDRCRYEKSYEFHHPDVLCVKVDYQEIKQMGALWECVGATLKRITELLANVKKSSFRYKHIPRLEEAVIQRTERPVILREGLKEQPVERGRNVWLIDPSMFEERWLTAKISLMEMRSGIHPECASFLHEMQPGDLLVSRAIKRKGHIKEVLLLVDHHDETEQTVRICMKPYEEHPPTLLEALTRTIGQSAMSHDRPITACPFGILQKIQSEHPKLVGVLEKPNYWIFQCNPKKYDFKQAVRDENLKTWRVSRFKHRIKNGDKVMMWLTGSNAGCYALATVRTEVFKGMGDPVEMEYVRADDMAEEMDRCEIEIDLDMTDFPLLKEKAGKDPILADLLVGNPGTNFPATREQYEQMFSLALREREQRSKSVPLSYPVSTFCADTGYAEEEVKRWLRALHRKGQVIFYGPPGTGKTYVAQKMARLLASEGDGFYDIIQFHSNYSYEEFMQGLRPEATPGGTLTYSLTPGRFLEFCERARGKNGLCVLVIDEINRANLPRVFGELMFALEYREREIPLAGGNRFSIPGNVRLIGTMNAMDRSIALVDYALRRRFAFLQLAPHFDQLRRFHQKKGVEVSGLIRVLEEINALMDESSFALGHSFFMVEDLHTVIEDIWKMEIEPYLEELFFDRLELVERFRWERVKGSLLR
ncbi:AAA family ATPase [Laceyella putida]|uniref:AAA family ATPase n=1 Tax=Laceyella putida TaxID=110101 RepID=A0ABW2RHU4_9BACL